MRRRTTSLYVPITISLKPEIVNAIEAELAPKQSRSRWIQEVLTKELYESGFDLLRDGTAMNWFHAFKNAMAERNVHIDSIMWDILQANCEASSVVDGLDEL